MVVHFYLDAIACNRVHLEINATWIICSYKYEYRISYTLQLKYETLCVYVIRV